MEGVGCSRIFRLESDLGEFSRSFPPACWRESNSQTRSLFSKFRNSVGAANGLTLLSANTPAPTPAPPRAGKKEKFPSPHTIFLETLVAFFIGLEKGNVPVIRASKMRNENISCPPCLTVPLPCLCLHGRPPKSHLRSVRVHHCQALPCPPLLCLPEPLSAAVAAACAKSLMEPTSAAPDRAPVPRHYLRLP